MLAIARSAGGMLLLIKRLSYPCAMGTVSVAALGASVQLGRGRTRRTRVEQEQE